MADRKITTSLDRLYSEGRHFPRGKATDPGVRERVACNPSFEPGNRPGRAFNSNVNQDAEDKHDNSKGAQYNNDTSGWVRGARGQPTTSHETAENYPQGNFDRGNAWRQPDGSIHGPDKGDKVTFQKGGDENEWAKRGRKS